MEHTGRQAGREASRQAGRVMNGIKAIKNETMYSG